MSGVLWVVAVLRRTPRALKDFLPKMLFTAGFAVLVAGVAQIYTPAAWILAGIGLMAAAPVW